jgi:HK97 family phage major capsid protein
MRKSIELKAEKGPLTQQYRAILNKAEAEKRAINSEEKVSLAKMDARFDELDEEIKTYEKAEAREASAQQSADPGAGNRGNPTGDPKDGNARQKKGVAGVRASAEYADTFDRFINSGEVGNVSPEIRNALSSDSDAGGGYLTASEEFASRLIEVVDNEVFMRGLATKTLLATAQSLGVAARTADMSAATWGSELTFAPADTGLVIGKREFKPQPLSMNALVSKKLLRLNSSVQDLVIRRIGYGLGIAQEQAYLTGNGANQPLGVFTPSTSGIDVSRDVVTGSTTGFVATTATVSGADCLINALYTLKAQYQSKAAWIFHRTVVAQIRQLKDLYGQYIWAPGISPGEPDRILNRSFYMSEYAPNTLTTGKYIGIVGDFSKFEIVDALDMELQVLMELFALSNQVGYIARIETDGMPVLAEAFVRIKCS